MRNLIIVTIALACPVLCSAQSSVEPFKVGTFEIEGVPRVSIVLRDRLVVDIEAANLALERSPVYPRVPAPADMLELIERYEYGLKRRLYEIVNNLVDSDMLSGARPDYVHDLDDVRTLPRSCIPARFSTRPSISTVTSTKRVPRKSEQWPGGNGARTAACRTCF